MNNINAIKFLSEGASTISIIKKCDFITDYNVSLEYSYNGTDWSAWDLSSLTLNSGDALYIRGNNPSGFNSSPEVYYTFIIEGDKVSCSGNIMSLINYTNTPNVIPNDYCFYGLFENCTALTTAPELPAKTLAEWCYCGMFENCTALTTAPELPAKTLADFCYVFMFSRCSSLTTAPELPAKTLADSCYSNMFSYCSSLTTAPELPAKTLAEWCYSYMFFCCSSLTTAPDFPATKLADSCYEKMLSGCTALNDEQYFN